MKNKKSISAHCLAQKMRPALAAPAALTALLTALLLGGSLDPAIDAAHTALSGEASPPAGRVAAVVVLGYALDRNGAASPALLERVRDGVAAWRPVADDGAALVFSGGAPTAHRQRRAPRSEAAVMADAARALTGADSTAWLLEHASTSTWENAVFSVRLLSDRGALPRSSPPPALLIATSPFHGARSLATFRCALRRAGVNATAALAPAHRAPAATPRDRAERAWEAGREVAALAWYKVRGRLCV